MGSASLDSQGVIVPCPGCGQQNRIMYARLADPVRCPACKTTLPAPSEPIDVASAAQFDALIADASVPVVVDFWAPWCGPCRMVAPELQKVAARQAGKYLVVKVDTDALGDLGARFGVRSIPTMAVFAGGKEAGRVSGARPASDIEAFVEESVQNVN